MTIEAPKTIDVAVREDGEIAHQTHEPGVIHKGFKYVRADLEEKP